MTEYKPSPYEETPDDTGVDWDYWAGVAVAFALVVVLWLTPLRDGNSWNKPIWVQVLSYVACFGSWRWAFVVMGMLFLSYMLGVFPA